MKKILFFLFILIQSATLQAGLDGKGLYSSYCSACHGESGKGGVGVPLSLPSFINSVDNKFLKHTIRSGRPGRVMPSFQKLSDAQIDAIVNYLRSFSSMPEPKFSQQIIKGSAERGGKLYAKNCASCHGENGKGGKGTGVTFSRKRDLPILAPALNNKGFLAAASDALIKKALLEGREGTPMISSLSQGLNEQDIDDLVVFIRSMEKSLNKAKPKEIGSNVLVYESPNSFEETVKAVESTVVGKNFKHIRTQYFDTGLVMKGTENKKQAIVYFCNFNFLAESLKIDPRIGLFLPCRITITEVNGKVKLLVANPFRLSKLFNNDELDLACELMHDMYEELMDDATL